MIPLLLDLAGRHVLVCGGGEVAARKTAFFLPETGVTVVSRSFHSFLRESDARLVEADLDELGDEELQVLCAGMFLVIAATPDPNLNDRIVRAARRTGAHANSATGGGDVHLPAVSRGERFLVAVATGGDSPGMARFLR